MRNKPLILANIQLSGDNLFSNLTLTIYISEKKRYILKALIEADRLVPLLRVYDVDLVDFKNFNEKKRIEKKRILIRSFFR